MSFLKKLKSVLALLLLTITALSCFGFLAESVQALDYSDLGKGEGGAGKFFGDLFGMGDQGLSFTQYEGQLAELSTEGYDPSLTSSTDLRSFIITVVNFA